MPRAKKNASKRNTASIHHHPYVRPNPPPAAGDSVGRNLPSLCSIVPFENLEVGRFYNAAITFKPDRPGGNVPPNKLRHRVLLSQIELSRNSVEMYYLTTFGSGRTNPTRFHRNHHTKRRMYIPLSPLQFPGYLGVESSPPLMKGWVNFVEPAKIYYDAGTPSRELIRQAPESVGISPPLINGPIVMDPIPMKYIKSMTAAWYSTINCRVSVEEWLSMAEGLRKEYGAMEVPGLVQGEDPDCEQGGKEEQQPWCGITCFRGGSRGDFGHSMESEGSENEAFSMNRRSDPINTPEPFTPLRSSVAQFPAPLSIGRNLQNTQDFQPNLDPNEDYQHDEQGYEAGVGSEAEEAENNQYDDNDKDQQTGSNVTEHPIYSPYRSYVVLWEIPHGEENDWEDMDDEAWQRVVRGGTLPSL